MALFSRDDVRHLPLRASTAEPSRATWPPASCGSTLLFAAMLGINRLFVAEHEQGGFDGFLLAPVDRTALLFAKAPALFCLPRRASSWSPCPPSRCCCSGPSPGRRLPELLGVLVLADAGIAVVGTLVAALAVRTRARDLIAPLVALPLLVPVRHRRRARDGAAASRQAGAEPLPARGWRSSGSIDLVFGLLAYAVFDFLLED